MAQVPVGSVRRLSIAAFLAMVVVYLVIVQGVGALATASLEGLEPGHPETSEQVAVGLLLPIGLADKGIGFVVLLLLATLCVGFAEEGMFRGIGVTVFRSNGLSEGRVALWSSVVFGAVHLTNAISTGGNAVAQAIAVSFAGYFFYLTRRVSGGLIVPAIIHGLFDFSILSAAVAGDATYAGGLAAMLAYPVVAIILLVRRHRIEPAPPAPARRAALNT